MWPKIQEKFKNIGNTIGMQDNNLGSINNEAKQSHASSQPQQSLMDSYLSASQVYGNRSTDSSLAASKSAGESCTKLLPAALATSTEFPAMNSTHKNFNGNSEALFVDKRNDTIIMRNNEYRSKIDSSCCLTGESRTNVSNPSLRSSNIAQLSAPLSPATKLRIEENKRKAQAKKQNRLANQCTTSKLNTSVNKSVIDSRACGVVRTNNQKIDLAQFSTGAGSKVSVTQDCMVQANRSDKYCCYTATSNVNESSVANRTITGSSFSTSMPCDHVKYADNLQHELVLSATANTCATNYSSSSCNHFNGCCASVSLGSRGQIDSTYHGARGVPNSVGSTTTRRSID